MTPATLFTHREIVVTIDIEGVKRYTNVPITMTTNGKPLVVYAITKAVRALAITLRYTMVSMILPTSNRATDLIGPTLGNYFIMSGMNYLVYFESN